MVQLASKVFLYGELVVNCHREAVRNYHRKLAPIIGKLAPSGCGFGGGEIESGDGLLKLLKLLSLKKSILL